jgi:hypothetical protein
LTSWGSAHRRVHLGAAPTRRPRRRGAPPPLGVRSRGQFDEVTICSPCGISTRVTVSCLGADGTCSVTSSPALPTSRWSPCSAPSWIPDGLQGRHAALTLLPLGFSSCSVMFLICLRSYQKNGLAQHMFVRVASNLGMDDCWVSYLFIPVWFVWIGGNSKSDTVLEIIFNFFWPGWILVFCMQEIRHKSLVSVISREIMLLCHHHFICL